ncbi:hypothetical protein [Streptomyces sp. NPDC000618]|uniref:hypothetical protein n=1 Tax=Streptomyces sp. NPDC000618 TaxID=3154265 RepID=UPI0033195695
MQLPGQEAFWTCQIRQELADLERLGEVLRKQPTAGGPNGNGETRRLTQERFARLIAPWAEQLHDMLESPAQAPFDWQNLKTVREGSAAVKQSVLVYLAGLHLQRHVLDPDFLAAAQKILDTLSLSSGVSDRVLLTFAESQGMEHTVGLLTLRFTDATMWALPVIAHEFGHHVARVLPHADPALRHSVRPIMQYIATASRLEEENESGVQRVSREQITQWLSELFADVYATYALGPAYPLAVITSRATPDRLEDRLGTHPSWSRRVWTMIAALDEMSRLPGDATRMPLYGLLADQMIKPLWISAGGVEPPEQDLERPTEQAREMVRRLAKHAPDCLRYPPVEPREELVSLVQDGTAGPPPGTTPTEVVNAAWLWRLQHWSAPAWQTAEVSRHALAMCARAAPGGGDDVKAATAGDASDDA